MTGTSRSPRRSAKSRFGLVRWRSCSVVTVTTCPRGLQHQLVRPRFSSVVPGRIPYGQAVQVRCVAPKGTGVTSIAGLYLVVGGTWNGMYAVTDTRSNGGPLENTTTPNVDPRVPKC